MRPGEVARTELEYIGEFRYHDAYQAYAPSINSGPDDEDLLKVIVFRLEQLAGTETGPLRARLDRLGAEKVKEVPVEQALTERAWSCKAGKSPTRLSAVSSG